MKNSEVNYTFHFSVINTILKEYLDKITLEELLKLRSIINEEIRNRNAEGKE